MGQALKVVHPESSVQEQVINVSNFHVWIGDHHVLDNINISIPKNEITCIIGPSGSGKSTLIRSMNRINDGLKGLSIQGQITCNEAPIYDKSVDAAKLRSSVGMVFQKPCVFPKSICENVLFGLQHIKKTKTS